jgi:hypothetical protein
MEEIKLLTKKMPISKNNLRSNFVFFIGANFRDLSNEYINKVEISNSATSFGVLNGSADVRLKNNVINETPIISNASESKYGFLLSFLITMRLS